MGTAFGLDSLESVARILKQMKAQGYRLDWVPEDGQELVEEIMKRKALPDFRWTTIDEIIAKGGAAATVPLEKYREWFEALPREAREKVVAAWGDPDAARELSGVQKLSFGLHDGELVIPGIITGNVFIGVQPKRGCAGARCDGEVCKILHDPGVPPRFYNDQAGLMEYILNASSGELFDVQKVEPDYMPAGFSFRFTRCDNCGEEFLRVCAYRVGGKTLCAMCAGAV